MLKLGNLQWCFEVLLDDIYAFHFIEEEEEFSMATLIAQRSLNRCHGYFEQTVPFYIPLMTFKATSVRKEDSGHGRQLPVGNPFGINVTCSSAHSRVARLVTESVLAYEINTFSDQMVRLFFL